ncbi:arginase family protein [Streptomyces sp. NPDC017949]|uniref:arginase family protein n=1 Tax=Streptomyces sp. NPDC017949 TaxID=3365020 RepID=UPI00378DD82A
MMNAAIRPGAGVLGLPATDIGAVVSGAVVADAVIMGLPFDAGVTGVPGQRHGPEIFRGLSPSHDWSLDDSGVLGGLIDPLTGGPVLSGCRVFDLGDLGGVPIDPRVERNAYYRALTTLTQQLAKTSAIPLFIGGDHSVSAPIAAGLAAEHGPVHVVCFDAHCDFSTRPMPALADITHGDFLGHLFQAGVVTGCELYGVRTYLPASCGPLPDNLRCAYEYGFAEPSKVPDDYRDHGSSRAHGGEDNCEEGRPTYLSIDLDVIDPTEFPATGHPEAGGYRLRELLAAVQHVCRTRRVVAVDIVEALQDDRENRATSATISALVMRCLRTLLESDQGRVRTQ